MKIVAAVALVAACDAREPLTDCGGDLRGVWRAPGESASGEPRRFQMIAGPWSWELYPMFDDGVIAEPLEEGVVAAPSAMDFVRAMDHANAVVGTWTRRYERRNHRCVVQRAVIITQCQGDAITLAGPAPTPPADHATCAPGEAAWIEWRLTR